MQYEVLEFDSLPQLVEAVNKRINDGWRPLGGVSAMAYTWENHRDGGSETSCWYQQALIREQL